MLKNLPSIITPDALYALASMGHGDTVAIVDANFPAARVAAQGGAKLVQLAGVNSPEALKAVLKLLPVDTFGDSPVRVMAVVGDPDAVPEPVAEFKLALQAAGEPMPVSVERHAFYIEASNAFAILRTGEKRKYGNVLLRKGVVVAAD